MKGKKQKEEKSNKKKRNPINKKKNMKNWNNLARKITQYKVKIKYKRKIL